MAIVFPLAFPSTPAPRSVVWRPQSVVARTESPFSLSQQIQAHQGQRWVVEMDFPPMTRAQAEEFIALQLSANGMEGTFLLPAFGGKTPRGNGGGTPYIKGASQAGQSVNTAGWTPSITGILKKGDYIQIGRNLLLAPKAFDNAAWIKAEVTVSADSQTDPEGGSTADRLTPTGGATNSFAEQNATAQASAIASQPYTFSIFLRAASGTPQITIWLSSTSSSSGQRGSNPITLSTGWQQFTVQGTMNSADTAVWVIIAGGGTWIEAEGAIDMWGAALNPSYAQRLHKLLKDADSDANGLATLDIWPRLRTPVEDFAPIAAQNPVGTFRLAQNENPWDINTAMHFGISLVAMEAVP